MTDPAPHTDREAALLPVLGTARPERADAVRNRRRILDTAEALIAERGVSALAMEELARAAGVGVGTLYRRFGDRAGLFAALLDAREKELQAAFMFGPPPLGPGAPALERIVAFLHAYVDYLEEHTELALACEAADPYVRSHAAAYLTRRGHLAILIREAEPRADADYLATALLAPLAAHTYAHQRREAGMSVHRIKVGLEGLAQCVNVPAMVTDVPAP